MANFSTLPEKNLSYQDAGVDIQKANHLVQYIKKIAKTTHRPGILSGVGGFGALFELPLDRYRQPVLVSGTDGVGTKLKLAIELQQHNTIGIDLVAMCVNDIITSGAEPLFFLDYFATGKLENSQAQAILQGIGEGCRLAGAALIGGETAEMPGMYHGSDYDLAGFCVGIVEKSKIIDGSQVKPGDVLIALASSGPHANGYSLIRRIIERENHALSSTIVDKKSLGEILLTPTRIYANTILNLCAKFPIKAIAHITGGGLKENIPRVLPKGTHAILRQSSWQWPSIFKWLQTQGNVKTEEMHSTFNLGVGMIICVAPEVANDVLAHLENLGEKAWQIGHITQANDDQPQVIFE